MEASKEMMVSIAKIIALMRELQQRQSGGGGNSGSRYIHSACVCVCVCACVCVCVRTHACVHTCIAWRAAYWAAYHASSYPHSRGALFLLLYTYCTLLTVLNRLFLLEMFPCRYPTKCWLLLPLYPSEGDPLHPTLSLTRAATNRRRYILLALTGGRISN